MTLGSAVLTRGGTLTGVARKKTVISSPNLGYDAVLSDIVGLLDAARRTAARAVNALMTATYWAVGRRIVEGEQGGEERADYGKELIERLSLDLGAKFGRGFGRSNLFQMRAFYLVYRDAHLPPGPPARARKVQTTSGLSMGVPSAVDVAPRFPLSWSHYTRLLTLKNPKARSFYEAEAPACRGISVVEADNAAGARSGAGACPRIAPRADPR